MFFFIFIFFKKIIIISHKTRQLLREINVNFHQFLDILTTGYQILILIN
jgi:hypothetical protein